jgi:hypothetical protein
VTGLIRQMTRSEAERKALAKNAALYSGEIPLDQLCAAFSSKLLEKLEYEAAGVNA